MVNLWIYKKKSKIAPNHFWQRNRLKAVHTLQSTLYTVHYEQYIPELSTAETSKERGLMWEMLFCLTSRLGLSSTLGKFDSIFNTLINCCYGQTWWIQTLLLHKFLFLINVQKKSSCHIYTVDKKTISNIALSKFKKTNYTL